MTARLATFRFVLLLLAPFQDATAQTITRKVASIADGDTLTLLVDREQVKVRLEGIEAPEKGQPYGDKARQELGWLVFNKALRSRRRFRLPGG